MVTSSRNRQTVPLLPGPVDSFAARPSVTDKTLARRQAVPCTGWFLAEARYNEAAPQGEDTREYVANALKTTVVDGRKIHSFAPFRREFSAFETLTFMQATGLIVIVAACLLGLALLYEEILTALMAVLTVYYFGDLLLAFLLSWRTLDRSSEEKFDDAEVRALADVAWPRYTILCPLYHEAAVVPQFVQAMAALDYPPDRLQILLLTEEDDAETLNAIWASDLPAHFRVVSVPNGQPRTKPRACNYGLLGATGDYVVIYDAEDIPDPLQLKKAVLAFARHGADVACVQAKLNFYNTNQNLLTRWFTAEYSSWFEMTLPGLQWAGLALPLGGTSNHFRTKTLRRLGGWDAFNVTEDCDLGVRLSRTGLKTIMMDSTTYEEANPRIKNWLRQRSRWIKGFMQTYLVHMRHPQHFVRPARWRDFLSLQLVVGARTLSLLANPVMWALLVIYVLFRPVVEDAYHALFPGPVLYIGVICLIFGNVLYIYTHVIGCLKREQYSLIKWTLIIPIYWAMMSVAAFIALAQLIFKPSHWEKTTHGLHLNHASPPALVGTHEPFTMPAAEPSGEPYHATLSPESYRRPPVGPTASPPSAPTAREARRKTHIGPDRWLVVTLVVAVLAGLAAFCYFFQSQQLLLYGDARSHLLLARRVIDSATPGLAQLGGVWLPLPHLAMLPFVGNNFLWRTGLAGACVSMPCYVIAAGYIFLAARRLTGNSPASFAGTLVFILNPNVLYLQTTPLSELISLASMTAACYYFLAWAQDGQAKQLVWAAAVTFVATMARYDGWFLFVAFVSLVAGIGWLKRQPFVKIEGHLIAFATLGGLGIALWLLWCGAILGDPLYFQRSEYSAQANTKGFLETGELYTYHDLWQSVRYATILAVQTLGPGLFVLGILGIAALVLRRWRSPDTLAALTFLAPLIFYVISFYTGQVPVFVPGAVPRDAPHQLFNVRYGTVAIPPAALFLSVLAGYRVPAHWKLSRLRLWRVGQRPLSLAPIASAAVIIGQSILIASSAVIALQDGQYGLSCDPPIPLSCILLNTTPVGKS